MNVLIEEHIRKIKEERQKSFPIKEERQKSFPDEGFINHWEKEIINFKSQKEKTLKKIDK